MFRRIFMQLIDDKYKNMTYKQTSFFFFLLILIMSACGSSPDTAHRERTLTALNGKDFRDTMNVSGNIPLLTQKNKSLYNIQYRRKSHNKNQIYTDQILKPEYRIIALESSDECMIGEIRNMLVDDSLIFVYDGWHENVFVFNLEGKFLNKVGQKGHARNEYTSITYMSLDRELKQICLRDDDSQKLVFYDYQGHFLHCEPMFFWFDAFEIYGKNRIMLTLPYPNSDYPEIAKFKLTITDGKGQPVYGALLDPGFPKYSLMGSQFRTSMTRPMHTYPDGVYYMDILSPDTIWRIDSAECVPILAADFGEPFTTPKMYQEMTNDKYLERINEVHALKDNFVFTRNFGYVTFDKSALIDLKTGKYIAGQVCRPIGPWKNLLTCALDLAIYNGPYLFDWDSDQFAIVVYANDILKATRSMRKNPDGEEAYQAWPQQDRVNLENLSAEDNPLIIVGTFNDFKE